MPCGLHIQLLCVGVSQQKVDEQAADGAFAFLNFCAFVDLSHKCYINVAFCVLILHTVEVLWSPQRSEALFKN